MVYSDNTGSDELYNDINICVLKMSNDVCIYSNFVVFTQTS